MLNQTFLRPTGGLADTPCPWRVNHPSAELVVDSFQLYLFWSRIGKKSLISRTVSKRKNELRVHIRLGSTCNVFRVVELLCACPIFPREKFAEPTQYDPVHKPTKSTKWACISPGLANGILRYSLRENFLSRPPFTLILKVAPFKLCQEFAQNFHKKIKKKEAEFVGQPNGPFCWRKLPGYHEIVDPEAIRKHTKN